VLPNHAHDSLISTYDPSIGAIPPEPNADVFQSVVITDVDGHAPANKLRAAAVRRIKKRGAYVGLLHDPTPVNEFCNPGLFPMIYPTLFPYAVLVDLKIARGYQALTYV
jgi:hypothetical protein